MVAKSIIVVRLPMNSAITITVRVTRAARVHQYSGPQGRTGVPGERRTRMERSMARGPPSSTVIVVDSMVVTTATSTTGRVQAPRVAAYRSTSCVENSVPCAESSSPDPNITAAPRITKVNASTAVPT